MSDFAKLLGELEDLQKASAPPMAKDKEKAKEQPNTDADGQAGDAGDDKKIQAAAKDGEDEGEKDEPEAFGKAFKVTLADGSEAEAFDGTGMLKALHAENEELRENIGDMQKAFGMAVEVITKLRSEATEHDTMLKAIDTRIQKMSAAGVGRKTMLAIAEKLTPGVSAGAGGAAEQGTAPRPQDVMAKAQFMAREGKLDWGSIPRIEAFQARGVLAPADMLQRYPELLTPIR